MLKKLFIFMLISVYSSAFGYGWNFFNDTKKIVYIKPTSPGCGVEGSLAVFPGQSASHSSGICCLKDFQINDDDNFTDKTKKFTASELGISTGFGVACKSFNLKINRDDQGQFKVSNA